MSGVQDVVKLLESHAGSRIKPGDPADDALLELLVHIACSDGVVDDTEIALLEAVLPGWSQERLRTFIDEVTAKPLDLDDLASHLETDDQRWNALRFAARMAHRDETIEDEEQGFLDRLASALGLPADAVDRVHRENATGRLERLDPILLRRLIDAYPWEAADFADGGVMSADLVPMVPEGATPIVRVGVDAAEVMGIYDMGLVARFLEGPAFLRWRSIVTTSRGAGLESSVRIHTDDGRIWSLVDARMSGIQLILDRLYRPASEGGLIEALAQARDTASTWDEEA